jgi:hypothetical protein
LKENIIETMNKILLSIIPVLLIIGCDKIPSGVVDSNLNEFQVINIIAPDVFIYNQIDSSFTTSVKLNTNKNISSIWLNFFSSDGIKLNSNEILLEDNGNLENGDSTKGDNVFSAKLSLSQYNPVGQYLIEYYITDISNSTIKVGIHNFNYYNGQQNYPPVISDLIMPDTVSINETFIFTIKVFDPNGLSDVKSVFFKFIRQDGSSSDNFDMHDDGNNEVFGDQKAGDGIYSFKNSFLASVRGQSRLFIFQAQDRSDSLSNIITHNIFVK